MRFYLGFFVLAGLGMAAWWNTASRAPDFSSQSKLYITAGEEFLRPGALEYAEVPGENLLGYDTSRPQQEIAGFGGALSDSSLIHLRAMPRRMRRKLLLELFDPRKGLNFTLVRVPIGATDFGRETYSYEDVSGQFDASRLKDVFAMLKEMRAINPALRIMVSPWSAPAWMKEPKNMHGGKIVPAHIGDYADYIAKVVRTYAENGLPVAFVTSQNEPFHAMDVYPTMRLEVNEQIELLDALHRALRADGSRASLWGLDHNFTYRAEAEKVWEALPGKLSGLAYHCYDGAAEIVRGSQVPFMMTECTDIEGKAEAEYFPEWLKNYVIGPGLVGSEGSIAWNLVLDEEHGPTLGPCFNCRPLVRYDRKSGTYSFNGELKALGQVSKFLQPGARRVATAQAADPALIHIAYENRDGGIVVVTQNTSNEEKIVHVPESPGRFLRASVPGNGAATFVIGAAPSRLAGAAD